MNLQRLLFERANSLLAMTFSGVDLWWGLMFSAVNVIVPARGRAIVPTDIAVGIPEGHYGRVGMPPPRGLINSPTIWTGCETLHRCWRSVSMFETVPFLLFICDCILQLL